MFFILVAFTSQVKSTELVRFKLGFLVAILFNALNEFSHMRV